MRKARKHYTAEEKVAILRRHVVDNEPVSKLCDEPALQPTAFYRRQKDFFENGAAAFGGFIQNRITGIGPRWIFSVTFVKLEVFHSQEDLKNHENREWPQSFLGMFLAVSVGFADNIKKSEKRQQERIDKGVESGELTKKEALKLEAQEAKLHREIRKDRKDGGGLTKKERAKIHAKQNKLSRQIARSTTSRSARSDARSRFSPAQFSPTESWWSGLARAREEVRPPPPLPKNF